MLTEFERSSISVFGPQLSFSAVVLRRLAEIKQDLFTERDVARRAGLPVAQEALILKCLRQAESRGIVADAGRNAWRLQSSPDELLRLADLLEAASCYLELGHEDQNTVWVALTRPARPSRLEGELLKLGPLAVDLEATDESVVALISKAKSRVRIMTPFFDNHGAEWVCDLFGSTKKEVRRELIVRYAFNEGHPSFPTGLRTAAARLKALGVSVYDYAIPREDRSGVETFHAKVVLADSSTAYVGSSNMTWGSLEHSMELGLVARGVAAKRIAVLTDAIIAISKNVPI